MGRDQSTACGIRCNKCGKVCTNNENHLTYGSSHSCGHG